MVLAINRDATSEDAVRRLRNYMERQEFRFPCVVDNDRKIGESFGFRSVWAAVLIGPDGKIAQRWWRLDVDALRDYLAGLKAVKK